MDNSAVFFIAITDGLILIQRAEKRYPLSAMALAWCCGWLVGG